MNLLDRALTKIFGPKFEPTFIPHSRSYTHNYSQLIPAGSSGDLFVFAVPSPALFKLTHFGNYTETRAAWGMIFWDFIVNGLIYYPGDHIMDQIGYGQHRQNIDGIELPGGSSLIIRASNPTIADCKMGISLDYVLEFRR